ncbi:redoxin domain-containing protein [Kordiimonas sp. SCSIO 12610]|uniref:redoxin domain-containing protein n=1 Tax=Kordiimonas sp. SCSIO 12610 TaxID=2829597 RepID=UPI00210D3EC9|nr:redoxin domain-containing protein [Kordiimonas sp. SCSIO 12610]UTW53917.1 redoxin domain-containing protein [Kordiimonas sp. SCSIO 12610]
MLNKLVFALIIVVALSVAGIANGVEVGKPAPNFTAVDSKGNEVSLSDFLGKPVVLEWTNHDCPYVRKHYGSGNMQRTQSALTDDGVVWLSIISSAEGEQGYVSGAEADKLTATRGAYPSSVLLDPEGDVGRLYAARTTPHMFLIDEKGIVQYQGAIDDRPSARPASLKGATNYVKAAWDSLKAGNDIEAVNTKPYGCSVKYSH